MHENIGKLLKDYECNNSNILLNYQDQYLSHKGLEIQSNKVANFFLSKGISKGDRIGICMKNSIELIYMVFGILKIGAIYVPIDSSKKVVQIDFILSFTEAKLIVSDNDYVLEQIGSENDVEKLLINNNFLSIIDKYDNFFSDYKNISQCDPAYIIFTSGTTGEPKGITMSHGSIIRFTLDVVKRFKHSSSDRTICRTPASFDPFLTEILPSIVSGGKIYLQNRDASLLGLLKLVQNKKITNFGCGPSLFHLMVQSENIVKRFDLSSLKEIYFGYEKMSINLLRRVQMLLPEVKFINGYGTSETFAATTYYVCTAESNEVFIGEPIESATIFLWNEKEKRICVDGEIGEIVISGSTLMKGYWNNYNLTREVIIDNPLDSSKKAFFTKDFGIYIGGNIKFMGRKDSQIKINGHRINLEEIREAIYLFNDIKEAIVYMKGHKLVCEYNRFSEVETYSDIKAFLVNIIEDRKIPSQWIYRNEFDRNTNTKIISPT